MIGRVALVARHLSGPLHNSAASRSATATAAVKATATATATTSASMTASLSGSRTIHTAACLVIGDEILNGKTVDRNSAYMAAFCFGLGIALRRIEVIADDEGEIGEAVRRMSECFDLVVTSGGIGPTHDDITYQSIAAAFGLPLRLHEPTLERMRASAKARPGEKAFEWEVPSAALTAKLRMAQLPYDDGVPLEEQVLAVEPKLWVPVSVVNGNVYILPGVPKLFQSLLQALAPVLRPRLADPDGKGTHRISFSTPLPESSVAGYLAELAAKVGPSGIKVGSYPRWGKRHNLVTLVGNDRDRMEALVGEVERGVQGRRLDSDQGESEDDGEPGPSKDV